MMNKSDYLRWGYINIKWYTGSMTVILDKFFPCTMAKYRLLLKTIALDYANESIIKDVLKSYFQNKILKLPEEAEAKMKEAERCSKAIAKYKTHIREEKRKAKKEGVMPDIRNLQNTLDDYRFFVQSYKREAQRILKSKPTFEKYIELL